MMNTLHHIISRLILGFWLFLAPMAGLLPLATADVSSDLPDLGDVSATVLSPLQEEKIGDQIMRSVMASDDVVSDSEINDYVTNLGYKLVSNGPDRSQNFKFFVVEDNSINAFAMPGAVIGVHTGLILAAETESQVAGVLGHEIGHVVQRHMARMLAQQKTDSIVNMASIAGALLLALANPQLSAGALTSATANSVQKQINFTRENEREADRVGLQIMADSGFDPHGMTDFFQILQKGTRFVEGTAPAFLRTHPLSTERIADVQGRVDQMASFRMVQDNPDFYYVRVKLLANRNSPGQAVELFRNSIAEKKYNNEAAQHYGLAIALMRKNDLDGATKELTWLRANMPPHPMFETLAANILVARNQPAQAAKQYADALAMFPTHRALIYGYAEHYLAINQTDNALKLIKEKQSFYPDDPYFYELMSRAYTMQGKDMLRHQAQGEAYVRRYNIPKAIEQMDLAVKAKDGDFYQQSIVEARLKELKLKLDEPKKSGWFS